MAAAPLLPILAVPGNGGACPVGDTKGEQDVSHNGWYCSTQLLELRVGSHP